MFSVKLEFVHDELPKHTMSPTMMIQKFPAQVWLLCTNTANMQREEGRTKASKNSKYIVAQHICCWCLVILQEVRGSAQESLHPATLCFLGPDSCSHSQGGRIHPHYAEPNPAQQEDVLLGMPLRPRMQLAFSLKVFISLFLPPPTQKEQHFYVMAGTKHSSHVSGCALV